MNISPRQVRFALHRDWDPIGVEPDGPPHEEVSGEYDHYVAHIHSLIEAGASADRLFRSLWKIETDHIGLTGTPARESATRAFAERLCKLAVMADSRPENGG